MRTIPDRLRDFRKRYSARRSRGEMVPHERDLHRPGDPQDVLNPRAKGQRKGKVTADRWNR
jgi:hypothetical protein